MGAPGSLGVVKPDVNYGTFVNGSTGIITTSRATESDITSRSQQYRPIVPNNLDYAVKAAMCDGKGAAWTADEQKAARERMGSEQWDLICDIELTEEAQRIIVENDINGNSFELEKIYFEQYVPVSDKTGSTGLHCNLLHSNPSTFYITISNGMSASVVRRAFGVAYKLADSWFCFSVDGTNFDPSAGWATSSVRATNFPPKIEEHPNIYDIEFSQYNGGILPVGTTLKVWGVRK